MVAKNASFGMHVLNVTERKMTNEREIDRYFLALPGEFMVQYKEMYDRLR